MSSSSTSIAAVRSISSAASQIRALVFAEIEKTGGSTCDEIEVALDLRHQTASARIRELVLASKVTDSGTERHTRSGAKAVVWCVGCVGGRTAAPFLKWVGGKRQLLLQMAPYLPTIYGRYFEPFIGGGALFFRLAPKEATLSDANERLVRTYCGIRDSADAVIIELNEMKLAHISRGRDFFDDTRIFPIDNESDTRVAAWFIYLNKTCFNGIYRVNRDGGFNVPFGKNPRATICDAENLRACSDALTGIRISHRDFSAVLEEAVAGDFVYFDPPYVPLSTTSSFTSYTADGFGMDDQRRLRDVALELKRRGVYVLLSNSSAPAVCELYAGCEIFEISATRSLNCKADGRGAVRELLIRP